MMDGQTIAILAGTTIVGMLGAGVWMGWHYGRKTGHHDGVKAERARADDRDLKAYRARQHVEVRSIPDVKVMREQ